jgi:hypothetical protein
MHSFILKFYSTKFYFVSLFINEMKGNFNLPMLIWSSFILWKQFHLDKTILFTRHKLFVMLLNFFYVVAHLLKMKFPLGVTLLVLWIVRPCLLIYGEVTTFWKELMSSHCFIWMPGRSCHLMVADFLLIGKCFALKYVALNLFIFCGYFRIYGSGTMDWKWVENRLLHMTDSFAS